MRPQRCGGCHPEHFFFRQPRRDSGVSAECLAALRQRLSGDTTGTAPSWYVDTWSQCHLRKRQTHDNGFIPPPFHPWLDQRVERCGWRQETRLKSPQEKTPNNPRNSTVQSGVTSWFGNGCHTWTWWGKRRQPRRASPSSGGRCDLQPVEPGSNQGSRGARAAGWPAGSVTVHVSRDNHHC